MKTLLCNDYQVVTKSVFSVVLCKLGLGCAPLVVHQH